MTTAAQDGFKDKIAAAQQTAEARQRAHQSLGRPLSVAEEALAGCSDAALCRRCGNTRSQLRG